MTEQVTLQQAASWVQIFLAVLGIILSAVGSYVGIRLGIIQLKAVLGIILSAVGSYVGIRLGIIQLKADLSIIQSQMASQAKDMDRIEKELRETQQRCFSFHSESQR